MYLYICAYIRRCVKDRYEEINILHILILSSKYMLKICYSWKSIKPWLMTHHMDNQSYTKEKVKNKHKRG